MKCQKKVLDELTQTDILEISEITLDEMIQMIRNASFILLPKNNHNFESQEFYVKMLIEMADIIHNMPSYIKHNNENGLIVELKCALQFFEEKLFKHTFLIQELNAQKLMNTFSERGLITT